MDRRWQLFHSESVSEAGGRGILLLQAYTSRRVINPRAEHRVVPTESSDLQSVYQLSNGDTSVIVDCRQRLPAIGYIGLKLTDVDTRDLALTDRHEAPASLAEAPPVPLMPDITCGFLGHPGLAVRRDRQCWQLHPIVQKAWQPNDHQLILEAFCAVTEMTLRYELTLATRSAALSMRVAITNDSPSEALSLDACNLTLPVPDHLDAYTHLNGRWGLECQSNSQALDQVAYCRENRTGRSSHQGSASVVVHEKHTSETGGHALACQLAWSGNHQLRIEQRVDGRRYLQLGELLSPAEVVLDPGATYDSPTVWCVFSDGGFSGLSQQWYRLLRHDFPRVAALRNKPRPVQLNTWEAMYFQLDESQLLTMIDHAAQLGIERFVLDDGWFQGRDTDRSSLGDWWVDSSKLPSGLTPLIDACERHGMEFGLWIEPEMVSPDSELYRRHPDWILHHDPAPRLLARHQLVLDLTRPEVDAYLFESISGLLEETAIRYLKWDMNRDIHQAGNALGHPAVAHQTRALYRLMDRINCAFPDVEIESCASGGGRVDCGILRYVSRFWPSDSNDALDRLSVQRGFSLFFPPELMGSHIGPETCHLTGRRHSLAFRGGVAFWGHLGIEMDVTTLNHRDREALALLVTLHKTHRSLLHTGQPQRLDRPKHDMAWGVVADDRREALFCHAQLASGIEPFPARYRFQGLDEHMHYQLRCIWPPVDGGFMREHVDAIATRPWSGSTLMALGIALPIRHPESVLIYHLSSP